MSYSETSPLKDPIAICIGFSEAPKVHALTPAWKVNVKSSILRNHPYLQFNSSLLSNRALLKVKKLDNTVSSMSLKANCGRNHNRHACPHAISDAVPGSHLTVKGVNERDFVRYSTSLIFVSRTYTTIFLFFCAKQSLWMYRCLGRGHTARSFVTRGNKAEQNALSLNKSRIAKLLTSSAQIFGRHSVLSHSMHELMREFNSLNQKQHEVLISFIGLHPFMDESDLVARDQSLLRSQVLGSRSTMDQLVALVEESRIETDVVHADLLLKRASKQQITLLVDMNDISVENLRRRGFYLFPIDAVVSRSNLNRVASIDRSLNFQRLSESLSAESVITASCARCAGEMRWNEESLGFNTSMACGTLNCTPQLKNCSPVHSLNPGGNRHYWGPVVPNLRNVWTGSVDQLTAKRGDRVGILNATVYQIFRDPSTTRSRKIQLPSPDPRVQWCLFPIPLAS